MLKLLLHIVCGQGWSLRHAWADWAHWIPRERNVLADALANAALDQDSNLGIQPEGQNGNFNPCNFVMVSDGAARASSGTTSAAWAILAFTPSTIHLVAGGALLLKGGTTALQAEATALELALAGFLVLRQGSTNLIPHEMNRRIEAAGLLKHMEFVIDVPSR